MLLSVKPGASVQLWQGNFLQTTENQGLECRENMGSIALQ